MRRGMKQNYSLAVRHFAVHLIDINEYLASFPGAILTDNIDITKLNEILQINMPDIWSK